MENPAEYLKRKLGLSEQPAQPEKPKLEQPEEKEAEPSMTIGRMEEIRELLEKMDLETFLGRKKPYDDYEKKQLEKEQNLIKEFLSAEENLDSNTKRKLYKHIFEENWKPKLEESFNRISEELKELEILRRGYKEYNNLSEEEKSKFHNLLERSTITGRMRSLSEGFKKLEEFAFDEQRLKELKEQFKKLKKK